MTTGEDWPEQLPHPSDIRRFPLDIYEEERTNDPKSRGDDLANEVRDLSESPVWRRATRRLAYAIAGFTIELPPETVQEFLDNVKAQLWDEVAAAVKGAAESPYWTIEEAADYARTTPDRIRKLRSRGVLSKHGDGGRALVLREELQAWLRNEPRRGRRD